VLQQLQVLLEEKILTPVSKANPLIVSHPLYGFDAQYSLLNKDNSARHISNRYVSFAPDAVKQQIALSARAEHDGVYPETFGHTLRAEVLQGYGFDPSQDCPFPLPIAGVSPGISGITAELIPKTLTINAIKDFLENPLQGWSRHILGLPRTWDADSESLSKDCEPYTLGNISKMSICRNVMDHLLAEHHSPGQPSEDKVQDMIKKMMRIEIEAGKLPSGAYLHYPKKIISDLINLYIKRLNDNDAFNASSSYCRYRFGQGTSIPQAIKIIDPLLIKIPKHKVFGERQVEITGDTQMMNEGEKTFFFFAGGQSNHYLIKPYLDCLCHSASLSGEEKLSTYTVVYAFKKGLNHHRLQLSPKKSYETLSKILFDMIYLVHDYHLTFQAISNERYDKSSIYKLLAKDAFESNAPIWRYDNYPIPEDDYIRSMVERRYQDILDLLQNTK
jgi:hypothetical protein